MSAKKPELVNGLTSPDEYVQLSDHLALVNVTRSPSYVERLQLAAVEINDMYVRTNVFLIILRAFKLVVSVQ